MHHCLMFEEDDNSSIDSNPLHNSMEQYSPTEHEMAQHLTSVDKDEVEEYFPTAPLSDNIWMEEPVPDRDLSIHEHSQHDLCPYPCPYCYVRQCLLVLSIVLNFFKCLGFHMCYISLYGALSLHNCSSSGSLVFTHLGGINKIAH